MLNINLKDRVKNQDINERTMDVKQLEPSLKWHQASHVLKQSENK